MFRRLLAAVGLCSADTPASLAVAAAAVVRRGELSASAIAVESEAATHELTVEGYSRAKALLGTGSCARSRAFAGGGHRWRILYFPNGANRDADDCIAVYLKLEQPPLAGVGADVMARFSFSLLDHAGEPVPWCCCTRTATGNVSKFNTNTPTRGYSCFVEKKVLEASACLRDDSFRIRCVVVVYGNEISTEDRDAAAAIAPPPPDIGRHLGGLLSGGEGVDVTFDVDGEMFHAHRYILAARSPVFKAELFGPMKEKNNADRVLIEDMDAGAFKVLLHFIYTDSLPDIEEGDDVMAMYQHLLVAADRYCLDRLKIICEGKLCSLVDASSVMTTLALADRHGCHGLKKACFQFLMGCRAI